MADEYISREAVCYQLEKQESIDGQPRAIRRARRIVAEFPAADVVEVVRCKECKHYNSRYFELSGKYYGTFCDLYHYGFKPDFFCAKGEKREIGHD